MNIGLGRANGRNGWLVPPVGLAAILLAVFFSDRAGFRPIDWQNYMRAAANLRAGESPYQGVEFFAPPWIALLLIPFSLLPMEVSSGIWLLLSAAAAFTATLLWTRFGNFPATSRSRVMLSALTAASPLALYVYVTGQITALAELALIALAVLAASSGRRHLLSLTVLASLLVTAKPHIVGLPLGLILLEAVRSRRWKVPIAFVATIGVAAAVSWLLRPDWPSEWLRALQTGDFLGGPGLAARGYFGLREAGVPGILLWLPGAYAFLYWIRKGMTPATLGLAIAGGLTLLPYLRIYDHLVLWPAAVTASQLLRARGSRTLAVLPLAAMLLLPLTNLAILLPILMVGLLLARVTLSSRVTASGPSLLSLLLAFLLLGLAACESRTAPIQPPSPAPTDRPPDNTYRVIQTYPHDPNAFTEGLVFHEGVLFEGTGLVGESTLRRVELESGAVFERLSLPPEQFGEGIAIYTDRILQLAPSSGTGFIYDLASLRLLGTFSYSGDGWGLTHDGQRLILSDGTSSLRFLDPASFAEVGQLAVTDRGQPVGGLNELEFVEGEIFANIWPTDRVARISLETGQVVGWIDLAGILPEESRSPGVDVLNGIAYDPEQGRLFVTGKRWPTLFEIGLVLEEDG